ncbi:MAG: prephenate dehydrogenase [Micromonosporaceae bacterium]
MLTVSVIGLGLIGGSLLQALAYAGYQVSGYDANPQTRAAAQAAGRDGHRWRIAGSVKEATAEADVTVLAVPLPAVGDVLDQLAAAGHTGLLSDVTSVKGPVDQLVQTRLPGARLVGGHPMAGKEVSGFHASDPSLFAGCAWALCLDPAVRMDDWLTLAEIATRLQARVTPVTAAEHDAAVAVVSHLPHLTASALAAAAGSGLARTLAAGSYRDGTRVAATGPDMVAAMCGGNSTALVAALDDLIERLTQARAQLDDDRPIAAVRNWLGPGHDARLRWPAQPGPIEEIRATPEELLRLGRSGGWVTEVAADRRTVMGARPA